MAYAPISVDVYVAAYAGIMGALANVRQTTDAVAADYDHDTKVAGAYAQAFDTAYNKVAPNELQLGEIQSISNEIFSNMFPTGMGSELPTGLNYTALANAVIARLNQADTFFAGQGIVPPAGGSVAAELTQFNTIATGALGSGRLIDNAIPAGVGVSWVFVKSVQDWFRWDSLCVIAGDNLTIVALLANGVAAGRYVRAMIPAFEWVQQGTWFIDSAAGNDENNGLTAGTAIKTDAERQRRWGPWPVLPLAEYHIRVPQDLPASDPMYFSGSWLLGTTGNIYVHANATNGFGKAVLANLSVDAIIQENQGANTPLQITSNGLAVSWTADGLINKRCRFTSGANIGGVVWPALDLGAKTAQMNAPQPVIALANPLPFPVTTFAPALNDTFAVESLTTIAALRINMASSGTSGTVNCIVLDGITVSNLSIQGNAFVYAFGSDYAATTAQQNNARALTFFGCRFRANTKCLGSVIFTLINCYADDSANAPIVLETSVGTSFLINFITVQRAGCKFLGITNAEQAAFHSVWTVQSGLGIFNNSVGPGAEVAGFNLDAASATVWGVCGAGGTPFHLKPGTSFTYRALPPGAVAYYGINVAAAPGAAWISYLRAQTVVTTAPTFDVAASIFTPYRALTPANLQATVAAGGLNGQWVDPLSGCTMAAI